MAEKVHIRQLVAKIANFEDIRQNNSVFTQRKKNAHFKTTKAREITNFTDFRRNGSVLTQKIVHLK